MLKRYTVSSCIIFHCIKKKFLNYLKNWIFLYSLACKNYLLLRNLHQRDSAGTRIISPILFCAPKRSTKPDFPHLPTNQRQVSVVNKRHRVGVPPPLIGWAGAFRNTPPFQQRVQTRVSPGGTEPDHRAQPRLNSFPTQSHVKARCDDPGYTRDIWCSDEFQAGTHKQWRENNNTPKTQ